MGKSPSALATFSFDWVDGDIYGLSRLAGQLYDFATQSQQPVADLGQIINKLVTDSNQTSWKGAAADGFKRQAEQDLTDVGWLSGRANSMGDIVDWLAVALAKLESWVENQVQAAAKATNSVTIDGSGRVTIPISCPPDVRERFKADASAYLARALDQAKKARKAAAAKLATEYNSLSDGLANYRDNHPGLLSPSGLNNLKSSISKLQSDFQVADKPFKHPELSSHDKSVMKDLVAGAVTIDTGIVGGVAGAIVGTFVEPGGGTVGGAIAGGGLGLAIGAPLGQWVGSIFD